MGQKLTIEPVTRVEGHGKVTIHLDDENNVVQTRLHIVEFRGFERFIQGIIPENPVYRQLLGLCPTLAVTNSMKAAMTMAGAVTFVLFSANVLVSLVRPLLKPHLRIVIFTLTIATFVTTLLVLVFGEVTPKLLAKRHSIAISLRYGCLCRDRAMIFLLVYFSVIKSRTY